MSSLKLEISKIADTLMSQSAMFNCSLEEAWKQWMHPVLTEQTTFEEVKKYIDEQVTLVKTVGKQ